MNDFERALAERIGPARFGKVQKARVGIAGAGGLGSNCANLLVRSGFKRFKIVDFDVVEWTNLNRQFYFADQVGQKKIVSLRNNLLRINPDIDIEIVDQKITEDNVAIIFSDCDIVVEALDNPGSKKMLAEAYFNSNKLLVCASGMAGWGNGDDIRIKKIRDNFFLVGDMVAETGPDSPPMAPRVNIVAAKEADIVLSYVLDCLKLCQ